MDPNPHLEEETLALLVDGTLSAPEAEVARAHLARCVPCAALYADLVETRLAYGLQAGAPRSLSLRGAGRRPSPVRSVAAGLVVAAAVLLLLLGRGSSPPARLDPALRGPIEEALGTHAARGLPLPGIEPRPAAPFRAGATGRRLDATLDDLRRLYLESPGDCERAWWLAAGYLAAGRLDNAELVVEQARSRCEPTLRFRLLRADLALLLGDPDRAARALEEAGKSEHVRLGRALVHRAQGREQEARLVLGKLAREAASSAVRERAQRALRD